jgi:5-methylcytosine-specific restriction endonuclease McrA
MPHLTQAYKDYISSPSWIKLKNQRLKLDKYVCQACFKKKATQVHHVTYKRLFHELMDDLVSVCFPCHKLITRANRKKKPLSINT